MCLQLANENLFVAYVFDFSAFLIGLLFYLMRELTSSIYKFNYLRKWSFVLFILIAIILVSYAPHV